MLQKRTADIRIIAIDMDGTLIGTDGRISPRNLAAINAAHDAGIEVVIATGRRHSYAMKVLRDLSLPSDAVVVSSNGTVTRTIGSELLHRHLLPLEAAHWLCNHLTDFRHAFVLTFDKVGVNGDDSRGALVVEHFEHLHNSIGRWMEANAPYIEQVTPIEACLPTHESTVTADTLPIQAMLCGTVQQMRLAEEHLLQSNLVMAEGHTHPDRALDATVAIHRTEYPARDLCIVDILPAGCSKGAALRQLARERNISPAQIMAIGDNWNDVSMFQEAGSSILMANAPDDLKAIASQRGWTIGDLFTNDGAGQAIEAVLTRLATQ